MRKFKRSKNYRKRTYRKRTSPSSLFSLSRTTLIGITLLILTISAFTSLTIQNNLLNKFESVKYTAPQVSLHLPTLTIPDVEFILPTIDLKPPPIDINKYTESSFAFLKTVQNNVSIALIEERITLLNKGNLTYQLILIFFQGILGVLYLAISKELDQLLSNTIKTLQIIATISDMLMSYSHLIFQLFQKGVYTTEKFTYNVTTTLFIEIQTIVFAITHAIINFFFFITEAVTALTKTIWNKMLTPFIAIKNLLDQLTPYTNQLTKAINKSVGELANNVGQIVQFLFSLSKHPVK